MVVALYDEIVETLNYFLHVLFSHRNGPFTSSASINREYVCTGSPAELLGAIA
jgi:hypothetical protein